MKRRRSFEVYLRGHESDVPTENNWEYSMVIDPKDFWSDKARASKIQAKVMEEVAKRLAELGEGSLTAEASKALTEAVERDIAAQEAALRHGTGEDE